MRLDPDSLPEFRMIRMGETDLEEERRKANPPKGAAGDRAGERERGARLVPSNPNQKYYG